MAMIRLILSCCGLVCRHQHTSRPRRNNNGSYHVTCFDCSKTLPYTKINFMKTEAA